MLVGLKITRKFPVRHIAGLRPSAPYAFSFGLLMLGSWGDYNRMPSVYPPNHVLGLVGPNVLPECPLKDREDGLHDSAP